MRFFAAPQELPQTAVNLRPHPAQHPPWHRRSRQGCGNLPFSRRTHSSLARRSSRRYRRKAAAAADTHRILTLSSHRAGDAALLRRVAARPGDVARGEHAARAVRATRAGPDRGAEGAERAGNRRSCLVSLSHRSSATGRARGNTEKRTERRSVAAR